MYKKIGTDLKPEYNQSEIPWNVFKTFLSENHI